MKKFISIVIGFLAIGLATVHFMNTYREGDPNWQYPVLAFGMAFVLYYTLVTPSGRRRKK